MGECIYAYGGSERARARVLAVLAIADCTLSIPERARKKMYLLLIYLNVSMHVVVQNACVRSQPLRR